MEEKVGVVMADPMARPESDGLGEKNPCDGDVNHENGLASSDFLGVVGLLDIVDVANIPRSRGCDFLPLEVTLGLDPMVEDGPLGVL